MSGPYLKISKGERLVIALLEVRALRGWSQEQGALSVVGGARVALGRSLSLFGSTQPKRSACAKVLTQQREFVLNWYNVVGGH